MRKRNKLDETDLVREEWDFSKCPSGWKSYCWGVESWREECRLRVEQGQGENFYGDHIGKPYLLRQADLDLHKMTAKDWDNLYGVGGPPYDLHEWHSAIHPENIDKLSQLKIDRKGTKDFVLFKVNWQFPDKLMLKAFAYWLKKLRKCPAKETRGNRDIRMAAANLKALGAYRLLKRFPAPEALSYTERILGHGLYSKLPDWYEANSRIKKLLNSRFENFATK